MKVSSRVPATETAAKKAASANANARPTRISLSIRPGEPDRVGRQCAGRRAGGAQATGAMPIASATAATLFARAGIILLENSGASMNSGAMRPSTRMKRGDLLLAELRDQLVRVHAPTSDGIEP